MHMTHQQFEHAVDAATCARCWIQPSMQDVFYAPFGVDSGDDARTQQLRSASLERLRCVLPSTWLPPRSPEQTSAFLHKATVEHFLAHRKINATKDSAPNKTDNLRSALFAATERHRQSAGIVLTSEALELLGFPSYPGSDIIISLGPDYPAAPLCNIAVRLHKGGDPDVDLAAMGVHLPETSKGTKQPPGFSPADVMDEARKTSLGKVLLLVLTTAHSPELQAAIDKQGGLLVATHDHIPTFGGRTKPWVIREDLTIVVPSKELVFKYIQCRDL